MFLLVIFWSQFALADVVLATENSGLNYSSITLSLCNVFEMASGNIGKAVAIFAIVAVGFGFFTGKFSISLVIGITLGIGILFGAPKLIGALGAGFISCSDIVGNQNNCPFNITVATPNFSIENSTSSTKIIRYYNEEIGSFSCDLTNIDLSLYKLNFTPNSQVTIGDVAGSASPNYQDVFVRTWNQTPTEIANIKITQTPLTVANNITPNTTSLNLTINTARVCRGSNLTIVWATWISETSSNTCSGLRVASYGDGGSKSEACISNSNAIFTTQTFAVASRTPATAINTHYDVKGINSSVQFKLIINPGFEGNKRTFNLATSGSAKLITATCTSGRWTLVHTGSNVIPTRNRSVNYNFQ